MSDLTYLQACDKAVELAHEGEGVQQVFREGVLWYARYMDVTAGCKPTRTVSLGKVVMPGG